MSDAAGVSAVENPWLSVVIPCYNVAPYIADCVRSVAQQADAGGVEILVCNDRSTDDSGAIVRRLTQEIGGLRLIEHEKNQGVSAARNTLIDAARGDYLWFLDGDDMVLPGAIDSLRKITREHSPDLVLCDFRRTLPVRLKSFLGVKETLRPGGGELVSGVFLTRKMHPWSKIARRSLWSDVRFPLGRWFEDVTASAHLVLKAKTYYYAAQSWVYYRVRSDGFVGMLNRSGPFDPVNANAFVASLDGYRDSLTAELGHVEPSVSYAVATFCGHEFANIAQRIVKAKTGAAAGSLAVREHLSHYRSAIEGNSPIDFDALAKQHVRRFALYRYWHLSRALKHVRRHAY